MSRGHHGSCVVCSARTERSNCPPMVFGSGAEWLVRWRAINRTVALGELISDCDRYLAAVAPRLGGVFRIELADHAVAAVALGGIEAGVGAFD